MNRRESSDFCSGCDYPLFFLDPEVHRSSDDDHERALRRRPGVAGRERRATSLPCPWADCGEPNSFGATTCHRCARSMTSLPSPQPLVIPPPSEAVPAPPETEGERFTWWWVLVLVTFLLLLVTIYVAVHP